jgi:hypothetical protein
VSLPRQAVTPAHTLTGIASSTTDVCEEVLKQAWSFICTNNKWTDDILAVMLMETFSRITRPDKYVWDVSKIR